MKIVRNSVDTYLNNRYNWQVNKEKKNNINEILWNKKEI